MLIDQRGEMGPLEDAVFTKKALTTGHARKANMSSSREMQVSTGGPNHGGQRMLSIRTGSIELLFSQEGNTVRVLALHLPW